MTSLIRRFSSFPRFSVAPMVRVSDFPFRALCRILSSRAQLYSAMFLDRQFLMLHDKDELLSSHLPSFDSSLSLQLAGNSPDFLVPAARLAFSEYKIREINLNFGCPSDNAQTGGVFGAVLMLDRSSVSTVARLRSSLDSRCRLSIKCRIGVDQHDSYEFLHDFLTRMHGEAGISHFILHARIADLTLRPAANRAVPPLRYERVYQMQKQFLNKGLNIEINGGISGAEDIYHHFSHCPGLSGVMLGRAIRDNIYQLATADGLIENMEKIAKGKLENPQLSDFSHLVDRLSPRISRRDAARQYFSFLSRHSLDYPEAHARLTNSFLLSPLRSFYHGFPIKKIFNKGFQDLQRISGDWRAVEKAWNSLAEEVEERENSKWLGDSEE